MRGMIAAPQPIAVRAGRNALEAGGNAFDAAVATAFAQGVVDPMMCGPGGWGNLTCVTASGEPMQLDFYGRVPKRLPPDLWKDRVVSMNRSGGGFLVEGFENQAGHRAVTTPGTIAGLWEMHSRFGRLSWRQVIEPAIELAKDGFPVPAETADIWEDGEAAQPGYVSMPDKLAWTEASRAIYLKPDGTLYQAGDVLFQTDLAQTLERIATDGPDVYYTGDIARQIDADFRAHDGFLSAEDLAEYRVGVLEPVRGTYRGHEVLTNPPPGGGLQIIQMLNILEGFDLGRMDPQSPAYVDLIGRVLQASFAERAEFLGDPEFQEIPWERFIDKGHAGELAAQIRRGEFFEIPVPGGVQRVGDSPDTTHVSVCDSEGNAVGLTHTLGSASGVVTPGLGFTYNNAMHLFNPFPGYPNSIEPGKRRLTGMCPTILRKDGEPVFVAGAPGGTRIVSAVLHTILNVVDHGMSPVEAVTAPRWHCEGPVLELEARLYWNLAGELRDLGWTNIKRSTASFDRFFARSQCITRDPSGHLRGGSDPRGGGGLAQWPV
jgi:gamma-glutamyltranspeptidase / glutathione hydrolase